MGASDTNGNPLWLSLTTAAGLIDVPEQEILTRAVPWQPLPVTHRIRYRCLILSSNDKGVPRFFAPDIETLLSSPEGPLDIDLTETGSAAEKKGPRHQFVERCIYRSTKSRVLFERPVVDGKRTWRSLGSTKMAAARAELPRRKLVRQSGEEEPEPEYLKTVGEVIRFYQAADYPDKQLNARSQRTRKEEARHCVLLFKFWDSVRAKRVSMVSCDQYRAWRLKRLKQGVGLRTIDRELTTLNNAFRFAYRKGLVVRNPLVDRPKYQSSKNVQHCRQFMPGDANELHDIARMLFSCRTSEVLGFQLLYTGYTGQRTCEILKLGMNVGPDQPGSLLEDGKCLRVWRAKGQDLVNPFCTVHDGLAALIAAHKQWIARRYPEAKWYFPGRSGDEVVDKAALAHALLRLREKGIIKRKITPHGARAWFVTVRRSHGAPDSQIALEIGHTSGGSTLSSVYGGVPPEWIRGGGPKMSWMPSSPPAWSDLLLHLQRARSEVGEAGDPISSSRETRSSTEENASFAGKRAVGNEIPDLAERLLAGDPADSSRSPDEDLTS